MNVASLIAVDSQANVRDAVECVARDHHSDDESYMAFTVESFGERSVLDMVIARGQFRVTGESCSFWFTVQRGIVSDSSFSFTSLFWPTVGSEFWTD